MRSPVRSLLLRVPILMLLLWLGLSLLLSSAHAAVPNNRANP